MEQQQRQTTWANLGADVTGCSDYREVLAKAGLDYKVVKRPIMVQGFEGTVPHTVATVKEEGPLHAFGFVGPDYEVCQNEEAFDFISDIEGEMRFIKAGETSGRVWIIAQLPEIQVLGDAVSPHLIFQNSHDGKHSVMTNLCMLRMICQNQFNSSFRNAANAIKIRHSGMLNERLAEARKVIAHTYEYVGQYVDLAERFARKPISDSTFQKIIAQMFEVEDLGAVTGKKAEHIESFQSIYDCLDNQNFKNTAWGVVTAYTDFATHLPQPRPTERSAERRFMSTTIECRTMDRVLDILEAA